MIFLSEFSSFFFRFFFFVFCSAFFFSCVCFFPVFRGRGELDFPEFIGAACVCVWVNYMNKNLFSHKGAKMFHRTRTNSFPSLLFNKKKKRKKCKKKNTCLYDCSLHNCYSGQRCDLFVFFMFQYCCWCLPPRARFFWIDYLLVLALESLLGIKIQFARVSV